MVASRHFAPAEYQCRCGCGLEPQQALLDKLDAIRDAYGSPITLTCASRCPTHNAAVGGATHSNHITGSAADLTYTPELAAFLQANLETLDYYMEDPGHTPTWRHVQLEPPGSGHRVFIP